ncbi:MAG: Rieske (2Fe-2S) protein [Deltaproteobacteria bacterium]|nr:Rieske (2Fe-2S) protein [Deltaproteobacteria bacterium]
MSVQFLQRNFFQRILGLPVTRKPQDPAGWSFSANTLTVDLAKTPELTRPGGAVRFEGKDLPERVLVILGQDNTYRAFRNRCTHMGHRRLDPVPGTDTVQCCSVGKSTYSLEGKNMFGPAPLPITTYPVEIDGETLRVIVKG